MPDTCSPTRRKTCPCGSGKDRQEQVDARGIFVFFHCDDCLTRKLDGYNPEVFYDPKYDHDEPIDDD